jgi:hypothetical protein
MLFHYTNFKEVHYTNTALAKSAKLTWGLKHEALNTIYNGAILPIMLYGAPVWIGAMEKKCSKTIYSRV